MYIIHTDNCFVTTLDHFHSCDQHGSSSRILTQRLSEAKPYSESNQQFFLIQFLKVPAMSLYSNLWHFLAPQAKLTSKFFTFLLEMNTSEARPQSQTTPDSLGPNRWNSYQHQNSWGSMDVHSSKDPASKHLQVIASFDPSPSQFHQSLAAMTDMTNQSATSLNCFLFPLLSSPDKSSSARKCCLRQTVGGKNMNKNVSSLGLFSWVKSWVPMNPQIESVAYPSSVALAGT